MLDVNLISYSSDVQGLGKPPGVKGKGQGKNFMTLNKPLLFSRVRGFPGVFSKCFRALICMKIKSKHCLSRERIIQRGGYPGVTPAHH